jgi:chromosomal replication initiation ATPase DnaA
MNMHQPMTELQKQHADHKARQRRFAAAAQKAREPISIAPPKPEAFATAYHFSGYLAQTTGYMRLMSKDEYTRTKTIHCIGREVMVLYPGVGFDEVKGASRTHHMVMIRARIVYEVKRQRPDYSYTQIGRYLGGRDHTTAINLHKKGKAMFGGSNEQRAA